MILSRRVLQARQRKVLTAIILCQRLGTRVTVPAISMLTGLPFSSVHRHVMKLLDQQLIEKRFGRVGGIRSTRQAEKSLRRPSPPHSSI